MKGRKGWFATATVLVACLLGAYPALAQEGLNSTSGQITISDAGGKLFVSPGVDLTSFEAAVESEDAIAADVDCDADCDADCDVDCDVDCGGCGDCCCNAGAWFAYAEWLNWRANQQGMDFAMVNGGDDPKYWNLPVRGEINSLSYDRGNGLRTGIGHRFPSCWDISWNYTYFHAGNAARAEVFAGPYNATLRSTRGHPRWGEYAYVAEASASLNYNVHDIEFGRWIDIDDTTSIRFFGSFRWADIDQEFRVFYDGRDYDRSVVDNPSNINAYGIRLGVEGHWNLPWGFSLFGRGAGSVLVGDRHTRYTQTDQGTDWWIQRMAPDGYSKLEHLLVDVTDTHTQALPVLETAVGVSWRRGIFEISGGYEFNAWLNACKRLSFHDGGPIGPLDVDPPRNHPPRPWDADEGTFSFASHDLILDGVFLRLTVVR